jgi:histidinol dehydrogenase
MRRQQYLAGLQDVDLLRATLEEINSVKERGEAAILEVYERKGIGRSAVTVSEDEVREGLALTGGQDLAALQELKRRCQRVARLEREALTTEIVLDDSAQFHSAVRVGPLQSVGIYIPDRMPSTLVLFSSLAVEAGVEHIMLALPPQPSGKIRPCLLAAASLFPVTILAVGGKSAFPALAFGLAGHVPNKLFGPCSRYVDYVKMLLQTFYRVPVDGPAGPSELVIFLDEAKDVRQVELDARAQMEHGEDSVCFIVSTDSAVIAALRAALPDLSSQVEYLLVADSASAAEMINAIAPEILEVFSARPDEITRRVRCVGNAYVNLPSPAGDYMLTGKGCADATYGMAAGLSGVTIADFYRGFCISTGRLRPGAETWLTRLPQLEGFPYHERAIREYLLSPPSGRGDPDRHGCSAD